MQWQVIIDVVYIFAWTRRIFFSFPSSLHNQISSLFVCLLSPRDSEESVVKFAYFFSPFLFYLHIVWSLEATDDDDAAWGNSLVKLLCNNRESPTFHYACKHDLIYIWSRSWNLLTLFSHFQRSFVCALVLIDLRNFEASLITCGGLSWK